MYCSKLVNLTCGTDLEADASNTLHALLHGVMEDYSCTIMFNEKENMLPIMFWLLSHELKGDIMRFWQFYWSSPFFEEDGGVYNRENFNRDFYRLQDFLYKKILKW